MNVSGTTLTGADAGNYTLTVNATTLADILRRAITIAANDARKEEGSQDPVFSFVISAGSVAGGDSVSGMLSRDPGEMPGDYAIRQGTLTAGANYQITFSPGTLTVAPAAATQNADLPLQPLRSTALPSSLRSLGATEPVLGVDENALCPDGKKPCVAE